MMHHRADGHGRRRAGLLLGLGAALLLWGCDGNNLFGPGVGQGPQITGMEVPASVRSGEPLDVSVRAVGLVRVDSIVTTARGGEFSFRRMSPTESGDNSMNAAVSFDIPRPITDTLVIVSATAFDSHGNASLPRVDTVRVFDTSEPSVQVSLASSTVGQGHTARITVQATDNISLTSVGYRILRPDSTLLARDSVVVSSSSHTEQFDFAAGLELPLGVYAVHGFAWDRDGNVGTSDQPEELEVIFIDGEDPALSILEPTAGQNLAAGDSVRVRVRVIDNDAVDSVSIQGLAFRGDASLGTDQVVTRFEPRVIRLASPSSDTTLTRFLQPTADSTAEAVSFVVRSWDRQGNEGTATVQVNLVADVNPPTVTINAPSPGAAFHVGDSVLVRSTVADPTGLVRSGVVRVRFEGVAFRGDPELGTFAAVERFTPREVTLDPPGVANQNVNRYLVPNSDDTDETVHFIVTAVDGWGNVGADTVQAELLPDTIGPSIQFLDPAPPGGFSIPLAEELRVEARFRSPSAGVTSVRYDGVAHRGSRTLGTHQEITRFSPITVNFDPPVLDTILIRDLQPTGEAVSDTIYIRAVATDADGKITRDSVQLVVGGPRVTLPDLVDGEQIRAGEPRDIRVVAEDPQGIESIRVRIQGSGVDELFERAFSGETLVDIQNNPFVWNVPAGLSGAVTVTASAVNTVGINGQAPPVTLNVTVDGPAVTVRPKVRIRPTPRGSSFDPARVEMTDSVRVELDGQAGTGDSRVVRSGYTVRAQSRSRPADEMWFSDEVIHATASSGSFTRVLNLVVEDLAAIIDLTAAPDTIDLDFFGFMHNLASECSASISPTEFEERVCADEGGFTVADGVAGLRRTITVVVGQTVRLPAGGSIADAVVDPDDTRKLLFLSNIGLSRLEVFDLENRTFGTPILVGAEPWGMSFAFGNPDRLFVANSGGTNISVVDVPTQQEVLSDRVLTPNTLLLDVAEEVTGSGGITFEVTPYDFSDRPQFVAQDRDGRIVYSTRPTGLAPDGTIRVAEEEGGVFAVYLFTGHGRTVTQDDTYALANIDAFTGRSFSGGFGVIASRGRPYGTGTIRSDTIAAALGATPAAAFNLRGKVLDHIDAINYRGVGSAGYPDIFHPSATGGSWDIPSVGLSDTTFIAASGDGSVIAIGEGATATAGRILLWRADTSDPDITSSTAVLDLVGNAAERVLGVDMNYDGTLGVGRGIFEAYFFDRELRLQGTAPLASGGAGVALHPLHSAGPVNTDRNVALSFVPVGGGRIDIYSTINFNRIGRVHVRDDVAGPLRASLPFASDNAGLTCPTTAIAAAGGGQAITIFDGTAPAAGTDDACTVVKLSGVSTDGGIVIINVTKADVFRDFN